MTSAELTALLDRLEGLEQAATPGEWGVHPEVSSQVVTVDNDDNDDCLLIVEGFNDFEAADLDLIAESRNALPILIRELRARL
jgi:hypothetical protein